MIDTTHLTELGIAVVPTYKGLRHPALANWQEMATTDKSKLADWEKIYTDYNYCCVAKEEGVMILDIDNLQACKAADLPPVPKTLTVKSPKGYHLYFRQTDASRALGNRDVKVGEDKILEVKSHNKAVAAPGAVREDGKTYVIHRDLPLTELPQEWIEWIIDHSQQPKRGTSRPRKFHPDFDAEHLFRHYEWEFASEFEKDGAMYYVFAECPLAGRTHEDQVRSKKTCLIIGKTVGFDCKSCGEEYNYGDLMKKMEEEGYDKYPGYIFEDEDDELLLADVEEAPMDVPLSAEEVAKFLGAKIIDKEVVAKQEAELPPANTTGFTYLPNDTGNAERLVRKFGNRVRHAAGKWYVWNGRRWAPDHYRKVGRMAEYVVKELIEEANLTEGDEQKSKLRFAFSCGERSRRNNMIDIAAQKPGVLKQATDFDTDSWLFNVQNGTVDLRTGEVRVQSPLDNITKISPVTYDPEAKCPLWNKFMWEAMMGDQEMIDFLAMAAGYSLTGDTSIQAMFFNHGDGENGKGVFLETLAYIIGDYAYAAAFDTFIYHDKKQRDIRSDLAALVGVRFLSAEESSEGHRLDEALIKQLTGENTVTTRFLYQDEFSYKPNFKIWMSSNFKPSIRTQDWGTWRRVKMIPWEFKVRPEERDEQLKSKLRKEASGILNWMLTGLARYVANGYKMVYPQKVEDATAEYRVSQDVLGQFISAKCVVGGDSRINVTELFTAFKLWAEVSRERHNFSVRKFGDELCKRTDCNVFRSKSGGNTVLNGIKLASSERRMEEWAEEVL
jgi:P4 family phage/plasmid primase-like protien